MRIVKCRAFCIDFTCKVLRGELGAIGSWFVQGVDYMHYENKIKSIYGLKGIGAFVVAFLWHYQHYKPTSSPSSSCLQFHTAMAITSRNVEFVAINHNDTPVEISSIKLRLVIGV